MKTSIDIRDELYSLLKDSPLAHAVNGNIYTRQRPSGSTSEDITIKVVAWSIRGQITEATCYVNIYTQPLHVPQPDGTTRLEEDTKRMRELSSIAVTFFRSVCKDGYFISLQEQMTSEVQTGEQVISCRISYRHCDDY